MHAYHIQDTLLGLQGHRRPPACLENGKQMSPSYLWDWKLIKHNLQKEDPGKMPSLSELQCFWAKKLWPEQELWDGMIHLLKLSVPPHWLQREPTIWHIIFGLFLVISKRFCGRTNHRRNLALSNDKSTQFKQNKSMDPVFNARRVEN